MWLHGQPRFDRWPCRSRNRPRICLWNPRLGGCYLAAFLKSSHFNETFLFHWRLHSSRLTQQCAEARLGRQLIHSRFPLAGPWDFQKPLPTARRIRLAYDIRPKPKVRTENLEWKCFLGFLLKDTTHEPRAGVFQTGCDMCDQPTESVGYGAESADSSRVAWVRFAILNS